MARNHEVVSLYPSTVNLMDVMLIVSPNIAHLRPLNVMHSRWIREVKKIFFLIEDNGLMLKFIPKLFNLTFGVFIFFEVSEQL